MSEIRANTVSNAAGTGPATLTKQSAAKAWVNFNGTGTIAARDSFNVASLTDNGAGNYTVNFSNAFAGGDYSVVGSVQNTTYLVRNNSLQPTTYATSSVGINCITNNASFGTTFDQDYVNAAIHGDLA